MASPVASHTCAVTNISSYLFIVATSKTKNEFVTGLGAPATRALANAGIDSLKKLSTYTEKEILKLHGVGPSAIPVLNRLLEEKELSFKKQSTVF